MASKTSWMALAMLTLAAASVACGDDDEGSGGGTQTGTGTGTATGTGGDGTGGMGTGGMSSTGGSGGTGGMGTGGTGGTGGGAENDCQMLCDLSEMGDCGDPSCLSDCQATESSANSTGCTTELQAYYDCLFALPDICDPLDCQDETQTLVDCTNN